MFLIVNNLCVTYHSINPFRVECEPFHDVISLYSDLRRMQIREENREEKTDKKVIRKRASDDAGWW